MLTQTARPPTDDERAIMDGWLKPEPFSCLGAGCLGCNFIVLLIMWTMLGSLAGFIALMFLGGMDAPVHIIGLLLTGGAVVGGIAFISYRIVRHLRDRRERHQLDVSTVEVLHCTATEAVYVDCDIEYDEDMMPAYALQVDEETVLFISEDDVDNLVHTGKFPCREFEIVISRGGGMLHIECLGALLPVPSSYVVKQVPECIPQGVHSIKGTLDKISALLKQYGRQSDYP
ncbi:MAG TPA: hypothetical protein PK794_05125 [Armatimonadota bacterium]|nr:hypothetical protein [Armatimonadota bacterium]